MKGLDYKSFRGKVNFLERGGGDDLGVKKSSRWRGTLVRSRNNEN